MALSASLPENLRLAREESLKQALTSAEGVAVLERLLAAGLSRVVVSPQNLNGLIRQNETFVAADLTPPSKTRGSVSHPRPNLASEYLAPRTKTEKALSAIWMQQIGVDKVGINDNFFELGGDSLLGLQVVTQMNSELGVKITPASLYEAPTVAAVAAIIDPSETQAPVLTRNQSRGSSRKDKLRRKRKNKAGLQ